MMRGKTGFMHDLGLCVAAIGHQVEVILRASGGQGRGNSGFLTILSISSQSNILDIGGSLGQGSTKCCGVRKSINMACLNFAENLLYSGTSEVVLLFVLTMLPTADHSILTAGGGKEAQAG